MLVLDLYAPQSEVDASQAMELDEILGYLKNIDTFELSPLAAIQAQTEAIGDPALPSDEHYAILEWLDTAFSRWEKQFPTEQPLASEFRKLLPLAAALAITDPDFLTPGGHSFHRLLDTMQASVIGWQSRLGRAGHNLERELGSAVIKARQWFDEGSVDLATVYEKVLTATEKDRGRAKRMAQRVVEGEQGRLKSLHAKAQAAQMINTMLGQYQAPQSIGELLKGPWYESAQLVLLRFGDESAEWAHMAATTEALLDSLQGEAPAPASGEGEGEAEQTGSRRQQVFEAITRLPRELKRWLVSLEHDENGVEHAIAIIESAHMAVLRQQDLNLQVIELIPSTHEATIVDDTELIENIGRLRIGQWFLFPEENNDPLRAQLVFKMESEQQLLFTNQAGIKAAQKSYADFAASLISENVLPLHHESSFSCSLSHAAKIFSQSDLESLNSETAVQARQEHRASIQKQRELEQTGKEQARRERKEEERVRKEFDNALQIKREREQVEALQAEQEHALELKHEKELQAEQEHLMQEYEAAQQRQREQARTELPKAQSRDEAQPDPAKDFLTAPDPERSKLAPQSIKDDEVTLAMGAWLGFHDGDKPLLAKLAAHDREEDSYIFVNRKGIKMRDLSKRELLALTEKGQIEILEARSSFKDEDTQARNTHKE